MTGPLPELHTAELDEPTLGALLDDLERHTEVLEVQLKLSPGQHADTVGRGLREAWQLLRSGQVRGVQVRYRYQGGEWRDTLLRSGGHVRIVRMRTPDGLTDS